jgi:acyl-CoA thioesterase II
MGDLAVDTEMRKAGDGRYERVLSRDWEIWGPMGGYVASCALRSVGAHSGRARPASIVGHFLGVASFDDPVVATCTTLRGTRRADSIRVSVEQHAKPIFEALVWAVDADLDGLNHHVTTVPDLAPWSALPTIQERFAAAGLEYNSYYPFWNNFEQRTGHWIDDWDSRATGDIAPRWDTWLKFLPGGRIVDPWVDACRLLMMVDLGAWPAASGHHANSDFYAPSIDVTCEFNMVGNTGEWLLVSTESPTGAGGLISSRSQVFDDAGHLLALGTSQLLCKAVPR